MTTKTKTSYHHGNLRRAMLSAAGEIIDSDGLSALGLRACARKAGVSHAAPAHHFGDLRGLLTALAAESFAALSAQTEALRTEYADRRASVFGALGKVYVRFAQHKPGRFRLMMRRDLVDFSDPDLRANALACFTSMSNIIAMARGQAPVTLCDVDESEAARDLEMDIVMTWSLIHGFAHLRIEGNFDPFAKDQGPEFDARAWDDIGTRISALIGTRRPD